MVANNILIHKSWFCCVLNNTNVTIIRNGIIKINIVFLCILFETSKFVYVPFFDFINNLRIRGTKMHPIIKNVIKDAFLKSSLANIAIATKAGIVNNG